MPRFQWTRLQKARQLDEFEQSGRALTDPTLNYDYENDTESLLIEREEEETASMPRLSDVFPDEQSVSKALSVGAITLREAKVLGGLIKTRAKTGKNAWITAISRETGLSRNTVRKTITGLLLGPPEGRYCSFLGPSNETINFVFVKVRGEEKLPLVKLERQDGMTETEWRKTKTEFERRRREERLGWPPLWRIREITFGNRSRRTWSLVTDPETDRHQRKHSEIPTVTLITVTDHPMSELLAALHETVTTKRDARPEWMAKGEWEYNLARARKRVAKEKDLIPRVSETGEDGHRRYRQRVCRYCHTPILFGYRLEGNLVTRAREYCSDACKMKSRRK